MLLEEDGDTDFMKSTDSSARSKQSKANLKLEELLNGQGGSDPLDEILNQLTNNSLAPNLPNSSSASFLALLNEETGNQAPTSGKSPGGFSSIPFPSLETASLPPMPSQTFDKPPSKSEHEGVDVDYLDLLNEMLKSTEPSATEQTKSNKSSEIDKQLRLERARKDSESTPIVQQKEVNESDYLEMLHEMINKASNLPAAEVQPTVGSNSDGILSEPPMPSRDSSYPGHEAPSQEDPSISPFKSATSTQTTKSYQVPSSNENTESPTLRRVSISSSNKRTSGTIKMQDIEQTIKELESLDASINAKQLQARAPSRAASFITRRTSRADSTSAAAAAVASTTITQSLPPQPSSEKLLDDLILAQESKLDQLIEQFAEDGTVCHLHN